MATRARAVLIAPFSSAISHTQSALERHQVVIERKLSLPASEEEKLPTKSWDIVFIEVSTHIETAQKTIKATTRMFPNIPVVALLPSNAEQDNVPLTVHAMLAGAMGALALPIDEAQLIVCLRQNVDESHWRKLHVVDPPQMSDLIGNSETIKQARAKLSRAVYIGSPTLLISGPTGVGKTRAAKCLHAHLPRTPFIRVDCSQTPQNKLEETLFGPSSTHEESEWVRARGGFLVLENLEHLPLPVQAVLDAKIEQEECAGVLARNRTRIIGTTAESLASLATSKRLNSRLLERFSTTHIELPALTERRSDIRAIGQHILDELGRLLGRALTIRDDAWAQLENANWGGNVRQLQTTIERALFDTSDDVLTPQHFDIDVTEPKNAPAFNLPKEGINLAALERELVQQALERAKGNRTRAGALLGMNRDQVRYRIEKYGLEA